MSKKADETRARILQTTLDLLASAEPKKTRVSDIAKAAGISRQALYLYFPTRSELLIAATKYLDEQVNIDASLAPSRAAQSGEERLDAFIRAWSAHIPVIYPIGHALMAMMDTDLEARAAWQDRMQAVRHGCAAVVMALQRDGRLRHDLDQGQSTDLLWSLLSVRLWEHLTRDCGWGQIEYCKHITRLAKAALISDDPE